MHNRGEKGPALSLNHLKNKDFRLFFLDRIWVSILKFFHLKFTLNSPQGFAKNSHAKLSKNVPARTRPTRGPDTTLK